MAALLSAHSKLLPLIMLPSRTFSALLCAVALFSTLGLTTGCVYRQTIAQGNLLDQADVDTLKPGMSKRQVALILGTPAIQSPFHEDRWDYLYSYRVGKTAAVVKNLSLKFTDGQLAVIEGDFKPGGTVSVYKPEDIIIEATREYQRTLREAEKERAKPAGQ
jgi:outer membrane protein assembly factor BamE